MTVAGDAKPTGDGAATDDTTKATTTTAGTDEEQAEGVTLAADDDEIVVGDDEKGGNEDGDDDGDGESEDEADKARKRSRNQRRRDEVQRLRRENEELRRSRNSDPGDTRPEPDDETDADLKEPKETDFPGDYLAFDRAMRRYETQKAIREENRRIAKRDGDKTRTRAAERAHGARLATYEANLGTVKDRIADFDTVMASARGTEIRVDARDMILESPKGPLLAYYLAKHPEKVAEINRMSPTGAAREIGRLESRIRGPQPKTVTGAKEPVRALKGGSAAPAKDPSKMTMGEYAAWRDAGNG